MKWKRKNRDRNLAYLRQYRTDNHARVREVEKEYYRKNKPARRLLELQYRGRVKEGDRFTQQELVDSWIERGIDPDSCVYCGGPHQHDDHVIPLSRGGRHEIANLVPACQPCNDSKSNKLLEEWNRA